MRAGRLKLVQFYEDDRVEMYDLAKDPGEQDDLAAQQPGEAARLKRLLERWRQVVGARMPTPNPEYRGG